MNMLPASLARRGVTALAAMAVGLVASLSIVSLAAAQEKPRIVMLGGPLWDPFFGAMKMGGDDAARDLGVDYQWLTGTDPNNFVADYAKLVKQAASQKPAAMVIGNYFPDTLDPIIKEITASGIPVIIQHDGGASWQDVGAISYVGFSARDLGRAVGERQVAAGAKFGLCVNHVPGNTTLDLDCAGYNHAFKAAGGDSKVLIIQFSDASTPTFVSSAIRGSLQSDEKIDAIWTIGAVQGVASVEAVKQSGRKIVNASLGLSLGSLEALKNGDLLFIADLQPYLDGYYALLAAYQYVQYKMLPMGQISTGPLIITAFINQRQRFCCKLFGYGLYGMAFCVCGGFQMFRGRHFDQSVILLCVRWYLAYSLSLRDLKEMMAERGISIDHSTIHRWVVHFAPLLLGRFNRRKRTVTGKWHMDETYIKVRGQWMYLYRAIDSVGDTVEFYFSEHRDLHAAKRFFGKALQRSGRPDRVVIDGSQTNCEAIVSCDTTNRMQDRSRRRLKPIRIRRSQYLNNRIEQDHRRIKRRIRPMLGFKSPVAAKATLSGIEMVHMMRKRQARFAFNPNPSLAEQFETLAAA